MMNKNCVEKDNSIPLKNNEQGWIDRNCCRDKYFPNINGDGYTFSKVRIRSERIPTIGDKFSSRSGQKGTVGILYRQEDMPFTKDGIVPDIIMNPHAIPSRMTIGQLLECIMGKACTHLGCYGDSTPFNDLSVEDVAQTLEKCGMNRYGNEIMYNSRTGEQITTEIFIGPTYYQRLKHMTCDKVHCLTEDHDVLTSNGWKKISHVTMSDKVACLDPLTKNVMYTYPEEVLKFPYRGNMHHIRNDHIDILVTPEHRMYSKNERSHDYELVPVCDLFKKEETVQFLNNAQYHPSRLGSIEAFEWSKLYAIWVASGMENTIESITIDTSCWEPEMCNMVLDALVTLDMNFRKIGSRFDLMKPHKFSEWLWELDMNQSEIILDIICPGDFVTKTKSKYVTDIFTRLCLHAGKCGQCDYNEKERCWDMRVLQSGSITIKRSNVDVYEFDCNVYCLRVPTEIFYIRRNGKCCWSGNSRASAGPIVMLTRQPAEGRARDGGLRMGEMEVECNWAHGIQQFLKERMMECSDNYKIHVCRKCGLMATFNSDKKIALCKNCNNNYHFNEVRIPYACKLLFQEIQTMSIAPRFITN
jgi:hypothetical protein